MFKNILFFIMGVISIMYLLNIGVGFFELIPDNIPFIGNLDEAGAVTLLIISLRHFGFDISKAFEKTKKTERNI